jgi:hypothetical protein
MDTVSLELKSYRRRSTAYSASWLFALLSAGLCLWHPTFAYGYDFTIDGHFLCRDGQTAPKPIVGARVEFWHNYIGGTIDFDTTQVSPPTHTDTNGFYSSTSIHGDDVTNYYAKLVLHDDAGGQGGGAGARLHEYYTNGSQYYLSPLADDSQGNAHFDRTLNQDLGASAPDCAIWQGAHNAYQEYVDTVHSLPPSANYDIAIEISPFKAWTSLSTTHWPYNYQVFAGYRNAHEFAHSVRHTLDGDMDHFINDASTFTYARASHNGCSETNHGFAFNEGWAEYWARTWLPAPVCGGEVYNHQNTEREGVVAGALYNLAECHFNGQPVGRAGMVGVLSDNPGTIHSIQDFFAAFQRKYPGLAADMFSGCVVSPEVLSARVELDDKGVDGSAKNALIARLSRREQRLVKVLAVSRADSKLALRCADQGCSLKAFELIVKPYALQSELDRTKLLESLIAHTPYESNAQNRYTRAADSTVLPTEFDRKNAAVIVNYMRRALEASKPLVAGDRSGALTTKMRELSQRITQLEELSRRNPKHIDLPRISLAEEIAFPVALEGVSSSNK